MRWLPSPASMNTSSEEISTTQTARYRVVGGKPPGHDFGTFRLHEQLGASSILYLIWRSEPLRQASPQRYPPHLTYDVLVYRQCIRYAEIVALCQVVGEKLQQKDCSAII